MPVAGDTFQIVTDQGTSGDFDSILLPSLGPDLYLVVSEDAAGYEITAFASTPEPASTALLAGALALLAWRKRRCRV